MQKKTNTASAPTPTVTTRSSEGLRNTLFEELDMLRNGQSTPLRANAVGKLAAQVIEAARLDLEFMRAAQSGKRAQPQPIKLGRAA
jgi:hypothetical protein